MLHYCRWLRESGMGEEIVVSMGRLSGQGEG